MRFLGDKQPDYELTYSDVFILPGENTAIRSRMDVDTTTIDGLGLSTPVIVANMNTVAGKRMAEATARRGALTMLVQNMPIERTGEVVRYLKSRHPVFETPITLREDDKIQTALNLIHKRPYGVVVIVNDDNQPVGIFKESDSHQKDLYIHLKEVMTRNVVSVPASDDLEQMFNRLVDEHIAVAPVVDDQGKLLGVVSKSGLVRSSIHKPALDAQGRLMVGVAVGINEDIERRVAAFEEMGVDVVLLDTANGHQQRLSEAVRRARQTSANMKIIAGTVVTGTGTQTIIEAGANIVKVGIGAGASCITRMQTGVGRPQFSAIVECARAAAETGGFVLADAGCKYPRDVALALAAGASSVMIGTWFAPTYESPADIHIDESGRMYVDHFGMASNRAVLDRSNGDNPFAKERKAFFEEGSSHIKMQVREGYESVEDILDQIVSGLRSACSYVGASNLREFHEKAIIGIQSPAAFQEGQAVTGNWS